MGSDIIIGSIIIGVSIGVCIGGNIWWAQRDRTIDVHSKVHLGRNEDDIQKQMSKMNKLLEELSKKK